MITAIRMLRLLCLGRLSGILPSTLSPSVSFLFKLAWESRIRLPILIAVVFMLTDYHLQLEIDIDVRLRELNEDEEEEVGELPPLELPQLAEAVELNEEGSDDEWETDSNDDNLNEVLVFIDEIRELMDL